MKSIVKAIKSRINHKEELTDLQKKRLLFCNVCPFNSENKKDKTFKYKFYIFMNSILDLIFGVDMDEDAICTKCGCNILLKSETEDEKCPIEKW